MSKVTEKKGIIIWIIICVVFNFLFNQGINSTTLYTMIIVPLFLYFFPVRPVLEIVKHKYSTEKIIFSVVSNFVLASILSYIIIRSYLPENNSVEYGGKSSSD